MGVTSVHSETANSNCLNPVLQIQRSYVKTISFSFCFLGIPPRDGDLPAFCDLQFLYCSHGQLDLGIVERKGKIFKLVRGRGRRFILSVCSLSQTMNSPAPRTLDPLRSQKWWQKVEWRCTLSPKQGCGQQNCHMGRRLRQPARGSSQESIRNKKTFYLIQMHC